MAVGRLACVVALGVVILSVGVAARVSGKVPLRSVNGGSNCAGCTIVTSLVEQLAEIHNETIVRSLERLCSYLPDTFKAPCKTFADFIGPLLPEFFTDKENPDTLCHALSFCWVEPGHDRCYAYPHPQTGFDSGVALRRLVMKQHGVSIDSSDICNLPGIKEICDWIKNSIVSHDPAIDLDSDRFSTFQSLRGSSWRGKDCNDENSDIYPGAIPVMGDVKNDSNCNGIYGTDPSSGKAYEEVLCGGTEPRGVAVLGDSISAHFHLPEEWFDSLNLSPEVFKHLAFIIENEIDWPMMSTITGHGNNSWPEVIHGPIDSIYLRLFNRNRCNHRDFQNIGVNGAKSSSMIDIENSLQRDRLKDKPMIVVYALVGNDVCNGHEDTFARMTTPAQMRNNTMTTLRYLEKMLPKNSHVQMVGLADGRILYDSLHNRTHPLGRYRNDFTYSQLYNFLNCLDVSPCRGWMNTNETIRNMTTQRAVELSNVLSDIAKTEAQTFTTFNLTYMDCPFTQMFDDWKKKGGQGWQLLEPVDGFHVNQEGQALYASYLWDHLAELPTQPLGQVNPNNAKIQKIFGDQGGY